MSVATPCALSSPSLATASVLIRRWLALSSPANVDSLLEVCFSIAFSSRSFSAIAALDVAIVCAIAAIVDFEYGSSVQAPAVSRI
jgi:hypothetical protein